MKDFFGSELNVGDVVAFNPPYYKGLHLGRILRFTPQKVVLEYGWQGHKQTTTAWFSAVVKSPNKPEQYDNAQFGK